MALAALDQYMLPNGRLRFLTHGENTTFRHPGPAGSHLVRVHRPQRHGRDAESPAAIGSEIAWLRAIRAGDRVVGSGAPVDRARCHDCRGIRGWETRVCSVLRWMDGRSLQGSARLVHLRRIGEARARLHRQGDAWTPPPEFVRIRWDHETFFGDVMVYGDLGCPTAGCSCRPTYAPLRVGVEPHDRRHGVRR